MKSLFLFGFIGIVLFVTSCSKSETTDNNSQPPPASAFSYLREDVTWTYINSDTDSTHAGITFETSYNITSIDPHGYISVDWQIPLLLQKLTWYSDTSQWADRANKSTGDMFTLIKSHPLPGDTCSKTYTSGTTYTITRKVMSVIASKTVPAGSFTGCTLIHETTTSDAKYYKDYWIHPDYGIIRMEGTTKDDFPIIIIQELKVKPF
jgi:hypothetical protein